MKKSYKRFLANMLSILFLLALWALGAFLIKKPFLPSPLASAKAFIKLLYSGELMLHSFASLRRVLAALAIAFPMAAAIGLWAGRSGILDAFVSPLAYVLHPLPKAALLPVIMLLFGLGDTAKIVLLGLIIFSQILVSARDAARRISSELIDAVRTLGAGKRHILFMVIVPATLPDLFTSLRISLGTSVAVLFLSETFASDTGLGFLIVDFWSRVAYPEMYAAIVAMSFLGLLLFFMADIAEYLFCPWLINKRLR